MISPELLQEICEHMAADTDAVVSVCGSRGRVIASSRMRSIGEFDGGAARIMAGEADIVEVGAEDAGPHQPECCARPVEFDDQRVFCVVVAAPLKVARRYSRVVQHWVGSHLKAAKAQAEYEANLEMSERRFRDVAESAGDWIWEMDANLRFTYESPRFFEIFPVSPERIIGKTREEFAGRALDEPHWQQHRATLAAHLPFRDFAYSTTMADGTVRHLQISGKPIYDGDRFLGYRGTGRDVTALARAMAEAEHGKHLLEQSERRFRDVADSAGDWIWEMDANLRFTYESPRFFEIFPVPPERIIGKTREEFAGRALDEPHWQQHRATLASHLPFRDFAYSTTMPDGSVRHLQISGKPIFDAAGRFMGYRGTGRDVTELARAMAEAERGKHMLEQSEQRFRDVADSAGDWIWEMDADLRFTYESPRFFEIFPVPPERIIGKTREEFAGRALDEPHWQTHRANLAAHLPFRDFAYSTTMPDGSVRYLQISGKPIFDAAGRFMGYRGTGRDVTEHESAAQALRRSEQRLQVAIESISEGFSLYDADDRLVVFNSKYKAILYPGIDVEFVPGMAFATIVRRAAEGGFIKQAEGRVEEWIEERLKRRRAPGEPHVQQRSDGRWIMVSERRTQDGGTVAVYSDITELKNREEQLASKTKSLEVLSNQLAKYLAPQVYSSIFSGKSQVKLASQRKKLTIFFSDIAGFTETADRLESEDLTHLLNHYLTEMSRIAIAHGATIDKYVGDAILVFFGDPETRGVKEDALACVQMAIAMRKRLRELRKVWRDSGIEKPLKCRIGINTGYCTVGNFGSEDRMDYTIIGGGVNLASRLESAAEPGEILISYETYAQVKDEIHCVPRGEVKVKGIAYPVAVYQVVDSHAAIGKERDLIRIDQPNLKLDINLEDMSADQRGEAVAALHRALERLDAADTGGKAGKAGPGMRKGSTPKQPGPGRRRDAV
jgi:PAS domain S-box-containing protein